jgi:hypothetical protein
VCIFASLGVFNKLPRVVPLGENTKRGGDSLGVFTKQPHIEPFGENTKWGGKILIIESFEQVKMI